MSVLWLKGGVPKIPEFSNEEIERRAKLLKPVMLEPTTELFPKWKKEDHDATPNWPVYMIEPNLYNHAYTWSPEIDLQAPKITSLREVARIETYHTCGYIAMFKPTIAEVLAQVPEHLLYEANAFTTLKGDCVGCYSDGDGHRSITILYCVEELRAEGQSPWHEDAYEAMTHSRQMMGKPL